MILVDDVLAHLPCSVELPAGTGKTETIGAIVRAKADRGERCLVLTHTHAGVDVIRRRLRKFGVPSSMATVRTLDSWCFDLIGSYPDLSGIEVEEEPDWSRSTDYHSAGAKAVVSVAVVRMLRASYDLLVVDEYQDCQLAQHQLVVEISHSVPTCVLGDRMQGLFFFGNMHPVDWEADVQTAFPPVEAEVTPWRWIESNEALGHWLLQARTDLMEGRGLSLDDAPISLVSWAHQQRALLDIPRHPSTAVAIAKWPKDAAVLALKLGGSYTMIEELEGKFLRAFASIVDTMGRAHVAAGTMQFVIDCAFGVASEIDVSVRRTLLAGTPMDLSRIPEELRGAAQRVNDLLTVSSIGAIRAALMAFREFDRFRLYRREAWFGVLEALRLCEATPDLTVLEAVVSIRSKMRLTGRRPESRIVGRTLLVKGLEFDHAAVIDPESLNAHELYVAITRGSKSVMMISDRTSFAPARPG